MASLIQDNAGQNPITPTNDPQYGRDFKGFDAFSNGAGGDLFKGLTTLADNTIKAGDFLLSEKAKEAAKAGTKQLEDEFGVTSATNIAAQGVSPTSVLGDGTASILNPNGEVQSRGEGKGAPPGVAKLGNVISGYKESYDAGMMSESYFRGRMLALEKQAIDQYPGYEKEVRQVFSAWDSSAAGQERKQLLSDTDALARQGANKQRQADEDVKKMLDDFPGQTGAQNWVAYRKGDLHKDEITRQWLMVKGTKNEINDTVLRYTGEKALDDGQKLQAGRDIERLTGSYVTNAWNSQIMAGGVTPARINELLQSGEIKKLPPDQVQQMAVSLKAQRDQMFADLQQRYMRIGPNGRSLYDTLGGEEVTRRINAGLHSHDLISRALTGQDTNASGLYANALDAKSKADALTLYGKMDDTMKTAAFVAKTFGDNTMRDIYSRDSNLFSSVVQSTAGLFLKNAAERPGPQTQIQNHIEKIQQETSLSDAEKTKHSTAAVKAFVGVMLQPDANPDALRNVSKSLFNSNNVDFITRTYKEQDQIKAFQTIVNPKMTAAMTRLGEDDPQTLRAYRGFVDRNFQGLFTQTVQNIQQRLEDGDIRIAFNENTKKFEPEVTSEYAARFQKGAYKRGLADDFAAGKIDMLPKSVKEDVARLNSAIDTWWPVMASTGAKPEKYLQVVIAKMGLNQERAPVSLEKKIPFDQ